MENFELDNYDRSIIKELELDGRKAYSAIAQKLDISNTMVNQRVNKMIENGILTGIGPIINEKKAGYDWGAFTGLTLKKDHDSEKIIKKLKEIPEITECYFVTGSFTLFVRINAKSHEHMREILYNKLDHIKGIQKTDSIVDLGCAFKRNITL
ncbi:Lrp/AsnC family transcriptional regulator [Aquimarina agarilytica]|uniref:Lrp/AsnC family transcriptional regulator n=1 Tax=Aquimarina agarilytica TaxID=1087449 RepID=UPI000289322D|nr:Lrp/AsnC ligand binding domain-containing protein [Aquimarina agarilytica]